MLYEELTEKSHGVVKGSEPFTTKPYEQIRQFAYPTAFSHKPAPTQGDRKTAARYGREVYKVTNNLPAVRMEYYRQDNGELQYDIRHTNFVLPGPRVFNYNPFVQGGRESNAEAEADVKALIDIGDVKTQLLVEVAQIRRTIDLFADIVSNVAKTFLAIKRGRVPRIGHSSRSKAASDAWLKYSYGFAPLANTLYELEQMILNGMSKDIFVQGKGSGKASQDDAFPYGGELFDMHADLSVRTVLRGKINTASDYFLQQAGLVNPLSTAWELVPWSFAIDWFIPVGNTLLATEATYGLTFVDGWRSLKNDYTLNGYKNLAVKTADWPNYIDKYISPGHYQERGHIFTRQKHDGWPRANFYADLTPFSTTRALNALALVRQLL